MNKAELLKKDVKRINKIKLEVSHVDISHFKDPPKKTRAQTNRAFRIHEFLPENVFLVNMFDEKTGFSLKIIYFEAQEHPSIVNISMTLRRMLTIGGAHYIKVYLQQKMVDVEANASVYSRNIYYLKLD